MATKVFITGGSGLLALNWAAAVRERYAVTLGLHERRIALAGVESRLVALDSVEPLLDAFGEGRAELVVHTAGFTSVEGCEANPELARQVNVELAANVAGACARLGLPLVHVSTDHLFPGEEPLAEETAPVRPVNVYGRSKAEAEQRVLAVHPRALVLRTNFYGWGPGYRRSFSDAIIDSLRAGREMTLFTDVFYTPILAESVARAAHELIGAGASGIYNVVGDERISKYDFGVGLAREFGLDPGLLRPGLLHDRAGLVRRPADMSLSNQKACKLLGRKLGSVAEGLARLHQQELSGLAREIQEL